MAEEYHLKLIEPGETIIFDRRHSLWEIWKNFLVGAGSIVALILLLTKFKPGPSDETNWGYITLISVLALFFILWYGAWPLFKRRNLPERKMFIPVSVMVLAAGAWGALMWFRNDPDFASIWATVVWIAFFVVILGWLVYPIFAWLFAHFVLTDRRVILSTGIINKSTMSIPLEQVTNIRSSQNAWERVFKYGDVVIETAAEYGQQPFTNIGKPLEVKKQIFEQREILEATQETKQSKEMAREMAAVIQPGTSPAPPAAPAAEAGVVERLEKLDELHKAGSLSDEEFRKAKEELLKAD
jgi:membrane protein YdbS with pleckstrin-like domain